MVTNPVAVVVPAFAFEIEIEARVSARLVRVTACVPVKLMFVRKLSLTAPSVVATVLVVVSLMVKVPMVFNVRPPIANAPVPEIFRVERLASAKLVMVWIPPPTEASDTMLTVPIPKPFTSFSVRVPGESLRVCRRPST